MLAIRMQRTGRKGHAHFRVIVQDSRFSPSSGRVVALLGNYDPHAKTATIDKQKAEKYLNNGAQPSERAVKLLKDNGVKMPTWVSENAPKERAIRNQEKLRKNRSSEEVVAEPEVEAPVAEAGAETSEEPSVAPEPTVVEEAAPIEETPVEESAPAEPEAETKTKA